MLEQEKLIQSVKERGQAEERIDSIWMYGSFAQGEGDAYSDVEFYVFLQDDEVSAFDAEEWIATVYPIYTQFFNEFGTQVVIFKNLVRGEFHFYAVSDMPLIESFRDSVHMPNLDAMCLCDKNGALSAQLQALKDARFTLSDEKAQSAIDNMINNLLFGWAVFQRGEIARSHEMLWYVRRYYLLLVRIVENRMEHWISPTRWIERELSAEAYDAYTRCTAQLCRQSIQKAYAAALDNLKDILSQLKAQKFLIQDYTELLTALEQYMTSTDT